LLATAEYDREMEFKQARVMLEHGVDALMLVGQKRQPEFYDMLARVDIPFINTWLFDAKSPYPCCGFDHEQAMAQVIEYLVEFGHTKIAVVTGFPNVNDRVDARLKGIRKALRRFGVPLKPSRIVSTEYTFEEGGKALEKLLRLKERPTAIVGGNDILAVGVLREAKRRGIRIPEDLSIVGFGDLDIADQADPPLTTIRTPKREIGAAAANYLIKALNGQDVSRHIKLDFLFCERETVGPPPAA
jgi:LacI family transcriptional regulator